ncbi:MULTISPECIES: hypothetical protein [Okeania]|uniref:hypothetical protein n=1 Tax=Okeania TaxID=1458928 RepID=UPI001375059B|nr:MULTISPECIES: hypothetical protein [Okeania]NES75153.1 hypothetical protein [Okeania sp. SIO1H4]NES91962.1 hypothetical protein [Okeania sp. SIO2B9]NET21118.1 hypothetical protein [Okeania sp. SIO1H5]NET78179.1 hypothetical protein [Okeania sp. SIO1F9]NET93780.1 hypothetical protein [Okeania sp. SIO1H2]
MTTQLLTTNHQLENSVVETSRLLKAQAKKLGRNSHPFACFSNMTIKNNYTVVEY